MNTKLKVGDLLYRSKGPVQHAGVYLGGGLVLHTTPDTGLEVVTLEKYANGQDVKFIHVEMTDSHLLADRLSKILQGDRRFDFLGRNCEHVAYLLLSGRNWSPQLVAVLVGALFGGLLAYRTRNENWAAIMLVCGAAACVLCNLTRSYDGVIRQAA